MAKAIRTKKTLAIGRVQVERTLGPSKFREESTMSKEEAAPGTKGVTTDLLASVDLGPEIEAWQDANFECVW
jgi:hypothetical protein